MKKSEFDLISSELDMFKSEYRLLLEGINNERLISANMIIELTGLLQKIGLGSLSAATTARAHAAHLLDTML